MSLQRRHTAANALFCFAGLLLSAHAPPLLIHLNPWPAVLRLSCFTPQLLAPYENTHPRKTTARNASRRSGGGQEGALCTHLSLLTLCVHSPGTISLSRYLRSCHTRDTARDASGAALRHKQPVVCAGQICDLNASEAQNIEQGRRRERARHIHTRAPSLPPANPATAS
jgi:hypothetical protein